MRILREKNLSCFSVFSGFCTQDFRIPMPVIKDFALGIFRVFYISIPIPGIFDFFKWTFSFLSYPYPDLRDFLDQAQNLKSGSRIPGIYMLNCYLRAL